MNIAHKALSVLIAFLMVAPQTLYAQLNLPPVGTMVTPSVAFEPVNINGITLYPDNPFQIDFLIDSGDTLLDDDAFQQQSQKLINYFMATLAVPEDELWVNLSPYEQDRIIEDPLSRTEMGRDMLAQDYMLKQLTASLMYPEEELGKKLWQKIYSKAQQEYGTTQIPTDTFNKVWIVPEQASVFVHENNVFIENARLKVMLEQDYVAAQKNRDTVPGTRYLNTSSDDLSSDVIRDIVIPVIEEEVNTGKTFANLRQIYHAMILARWYKHNLNSSMLNLVYANHNNLDGIDSVSPDNKDALYAQYVASFKQGVYNYIKEEIDPGTDTIMPRHYFSGGLDRGLVARTNTGALTVEATRSAEKTDKRLAVDVTPTMKTSKDGSMNARDRSIQSDPSTSAREDESMNTTPASMHLRRAALDRSTLQAMDRYKKFIREVNLVQYENRHAFEKEVFRENAYGMLLALKNKSSLGAVDGYLANIINNKPAVKDVTMEMLYLYLSSVGFDWPKMVSKPTTILELNKVMRFIKGGEVFYRRALLLFAADLLPSAGDIQLYFSHDILNPNTVSQLDDGLKKEMIALLMRRYVRDGHRVILPMDLRPEVLADIQKKGALYQPQKEDTGTLGNRFLFVHEKSNLNGYVNIQEEIAVIEEKSDVAEEENNLIHLTLKTGFNAEGLSYELGMRESGEVFFINAGEEPEPLLFIVERDGLSEEDDAMIVEEQKLLTMMRVFRAKYATPQGDTSYAAKLAQLLYTKVNEREGFINAVLSEVMVQLAKYIYPENGYNKDYLRKDLTRLIYHYLDDVGLNIDLENIPSFESVDVFVQFLEGWSQDKVREALTLFVLDFGGRNFIAQQIDEVNNMIANKVNMRQQMDTTAQKLSKNGRTMARISSSFVKVANKQDRELVIARQRLAVLEARHDLHHVFDSALSIKADNRINTDNKTSTGGIDFNADSVNIQSQGDVIQFQLDHAMLINLKQQPGIQIVPQIIQITPILDFRPLVGLKKEEPLLAKSG